MKKALALVVVATMGLTSGCGSTDPEESVTGATSSDGATMDAMDAEMEPKDQPLGIVPSTPAGEVTEVVPGLNITLPQGSAISDTGTTEGVEETVTYRMPDAEGGLPALQVKAATGIDVYAESWVKESSFTVNAAITNEHRSIEQWPGADRAVAFNWSEDVALTTGEVTKTEVASLWLATESGQFYVVMAVAPEGELQASAVLDAMLSAELVGS